MYIYSDYHYDGPSFDNSICAVVMSSIKLVQNVEINSDVDTDHENNKIDDYLINFGKPWWKVPNLIKLNFWIAILTLPSTNSGYDGSLLNGLQSLDQWASFFGYPKGIRLGLLTAGIFFGNLIATLRVADVISDRFGRKVAIGVGQSLLIIGAIVQGSAQNYSQFFISRILLGFSFIGSVSAPVLISELSYPSHRGFNTAIFNTTWYLGALIASSVTYGTFLHVTGNYAWRMPSYLQGVFSVITLISLPWTPESPRYLIKKGKDDKARSILLKYHANNNEELGGPLVDFEIKEIRDALQFEIIAKSTKFTAFFQTRANLKRLFFNGSIGFMMNFSGNGLVSYYLNLVLNSIGITDTEQQLRINILLMFYNWISALISAYLVNRLRRRVMFLISTGSMLLTYIIWTALSAINQKTNFENKSLGSGVLAMIFLFYFAYNFGLNVLPAVYSTEVLPYNLRAKGYNFLMLICTLGNIFNAFVNPIAMDAIEWKYYIVYCCTLGFNFAVVYFTFVETYGYTLEEVSELVFKEDVRRTLPLERSKHV